ncbi:MATE family efflux transporter [Thermosipho atlanticus]|uniref:Putative efflux protein, MATE family n=1 Tax=Thermosipho atlanticus DSM 15807 TaxID=1123380 RepID=A0A1M5RNU0_9BACT|nr:MATE family efflux transporter [Thermosipho atlanticus]SHH27790.1 putative efflux protein, MATE family [Thermosipho atlanticus DSM 15807]
MGVYRKIFKIALPIALQQFLFTSVNFVDTVMIGRLGEIPIAAVGLSNQFFFLYNLVLFGLVSGGAIFFAQFWGKRDEDGLARSSALTVISALAFSFIFFVLSFFTPQFVMRFYSPDPEVIAVGITYLKIVSFSYPIFAVSMVFSLVLRSIEKAIIPMYTTIVELMSNVFFNYVLIFGKLGFPKLGVEGAAWGTLIARVIGLTSLLIIIEVKRLPGRFNLYHVRRINKLFVKRYFHYTLPTIGNEFAWSFGMTMYSVVYAHMSTQVIAARNIMGTIEGFAYSFTFSVASAASVIVGNILGASEYEKAYEVSKKILKLAELVAVISGIITILVTFYAVNLFDVSDEIKNLVRITMIISMGFIPIKVFNGVNIVGFLRAGGDTRFSFAIEATTLWLLGVPLAVLSGLILNMSFPVVYLFTMSDEITKAIILLWRYKSKKWIKNVVEGI